jgi:N-acetylglutamate synthase-like GNAT family acetyltransferase
MDGIVIRAATPRDQAAIVELVRSEPLNPAGLEWQRFVVAIDRGGLAGTVQMRHHADGSRELGSLVVRRDLRGRGVAARLIDALLQRHEDRVLLVTRTTRAPYFAPWGFSPIAPNAAPPPLRRQRRLGQWGGGLVALLRGRLPRRLVILERSPAAA